MKSLKFLNKYFLKYRSRFIWGVVFIVISNVFAIFPAQIIREAFNVVQEEIEPGSLSLESKESYIHILFEGFSLTQTLVIFAILVVVMALLKGLFTFFTRQTIIIMSRLIEFDLKNEIYAHYQSLSPSFYRSKNTGDIMNRISEDVSRVRMYLGPAIMYSINMIVLFALVISTMLTINPKLTLYSVLPLPFLSAIIYYVSNIINKKSELVQAQLSDISSAAQESFSGIRILKSYVREAYAISQYSDKSNKYKTLSLSLVKTEAIFMPVMMLLIGMSTILTVYIGGLEAIAGNIEIGNIAEFVIYVNMLTWPVAAIGWVTSLTQRAAASQRRINEFLETEPEFKNGGKEITKLEKSIVFSNVSFTYSDSGTTALKDISFEIKKGGTLGIIGRTGAGKTSIVDLLCRNSAASAGEIRIDNINILDLDIKSLREQMGVVPQEGFLFSDSIFENIAFGIKDEAGLKEAVESAAADAEILDNILEFPDSFNTVVGERGITLSGGQKQRVSIARALIKKPSILIFDDCLSAVDTVTERKILDNFKKHIRENTCILISHRVSTVEHADEIIVLEGGKIIERGNHKELLKNKGLYLELFNLQKMEEQTLEV